jgi:hypothetical protein
LPGPEAPPNRRAEARSAQPEARRGPRPEASEEQCLHRLAEHPRQGRRNSNPARRAPPERSTARREREDLPKLGGSLAAWLD